MGAHHDFARPFPVWVNARRNTSPVPFRDIAQIRIKPRPIDRNAIRGIQHHRSATSNVTKKLNSPLVAPHGNGHKTHMPFAPHVFRHTPALRGHIKPPATSEMRFGQDRFVELEDQAKEEGWPDDWKMEETEREANRARVLANILGQDLWVFAYGSLIWDPAVHIAEYRYGSLAGWKRSFCMRLEGGRGSPELPGLMAALDAGGQCDGVVFRIAANQIETETAFMWRREMFSGSYVPMFLPVETPQGPIQALTFVIDKTNRRYCPDVSVEDTAKIIATAEGNLGTNFEYLDALVRQLKQLDLADDEMFTLHARASAIRENQTL